MLFTFYEEIKIFSSSDYETSEHFYNTAMEPRCLEVKPSFSN